MSIDGHGYLPFPVVAWFGATSMSGYPTFITGSPFLIQD